MKNIKKNIILFIVISVLVLYFILINDYKEIIEVLLNSKKIIIIQILAVILIGDIIKAYSLYLIIKKNKKEIKLMDCIKLTFITNFFNGITPFSLGGQPFQLYNLKKEHNLNYSTSISILFKDFYSYQIALVFLLSLALIINKIFNILILNNFIKKLIILGFILNIVVLIFLVLLPFNKNNYSKIINVILNFINKFKELKDRENLQIKIENRIINLKNELKEINKNLNLIFKCSLLNIIKILSLCFAAYLSIYSITNNINFMYTILITILVLNIGSIIPVPGGSFGIEMAFLSLFSVFVTNIKLKAAMILWRACSYYLPVIFGGYVLVFNKRK